MGPSYETQFTVCYIYSCVITLVGIDLSNVGKTTYGCLRRLIAGEQEYFYMLNILAKSIQYPIPGYDTSDNILVNVFRLSG